MEKVPGKSDSGQGYIEAATDLSLSSTGAAAGLARGQTLTTFSGHTDWVRGVAVTPAGDQAISASFDGTLRVWDLATGQTVATLEGHTGRVNGVALTPSAGEYLIRRIDDASRQVIICLGILVNKRRGRRRITAGHHNELGVVPQPLHYF